MKPLARVVPSSLVFLALAAEVCGQIPTTGSVTGRVTDPTGLGVLGVLVSGTCPPSTASTASARTDTNGVYTLGGLTAGPCRLVFEYEGFRRQEHRLVVAGKSMLTLDVQLELAAIPQTVKVVMALDETTPETIRGEVAFPSDIIDQLPVARSPEQVALLTPGVTGNGPNGALTMAGAFSFGNLSLLDGMVTNDSTRGQARGFHVADAVQEIRVATSGIPAEFGRFQGGVIQTITRSGGNTVSASLRIGITNDRWRALTPYRGDATVNRRAPSWETSLGGPLVRGRLYFFGAAQRLRNEQRRTLSHTFGNYAYTEDDRKYEGKLTWALSRASTIKASCFRVNSIRVGVASGAVMDVASLADSRSPEWLAGVTWNAAISRRLLSEVRYSQRLLAYSPSGATDTSLTGGTPIWDRSRSDARFNSPAGCAVCDGAADERGSQNVVAKIWYAAPSRRGTHEIVAGVDLFRETRRTNSYQSGSGFRVRATRAILQDGRAYPVFLPDRTTWIYWMPILQSSSGNDLRTFSAFVSDNWRAAARLTVKAGIRIDRNYARDSVGRTAVDEVTISPRGGVTWDVRGDRCWLLNASAARYVAAVASTIADSASPGGRPATYVYDYLGPSVNAGTPASPASPHDALGTLFDWFLAGPGTARATRSTPAIPGVNLSMDPAFAPLDTFETMVGVTRQLGARGGVRVDAVFRRYLNFYANRRDLTTGQVVDVAGNRLDAIVIANAHDQVLRRYRGLLVQGWYQAGTRLRLQGSYTLSSTWGNVEGEDASVGPTMVTLMDYPEYREARWSAPMGSVGTDQRHRLRLWATWTPKTPAAVGRFSVGVIQRRESGSAWSAQGNINPRAYVTNPGYVTPPSAVPYYFSARGAFRTGAVATTDLQLSWTHQVPGLKRGQWFVRGVLTNIFNRATPVRVNKTVLTRNDSVTYLAFNPFTQAPVEGVHYGFGSDFGRPVGPFDYQPPREFALSLGLRF